MEEHTVQMDEHTVQMEEHTVQMEEHTVQMEEHTVQMEEHTVQMEEHTVQMDFVRSGFTKSSLSLQAARLVLGTALDTGNNLRKGTSGIKKLEFSPVCPHFRTCFNPTCKSEFCGIYRPSTVNRFPTLQLQTQYLGKDILMSTPIT